MSLQSNARCETDGGSSSEGEEQDEPSSSQIDDVETVLSNFREKWQKELKVSARDATEPVNNGVDDYESKAKMLFLKGVEMEKCGKLYEAIQFYRRAVQLVPDIEFRTATSTTNRRHRSPSHSSNENSSEEEDEGDDDDEDGDEDDIKEGELLQRIQKKRSRMTAICQAKFEQRTTHISSLPMEMVLHILRWVVSTDLDVRSLEMFSMVCRGFYLCARDAELWKSACLRVWGRTSVGDVPPKEYATWRHMFIERHRVNFNGCYIGKTTYIRHGENSFQDQFYRPWHLVAYHRYIRFFPEGVALVLTSSDEPAQCVSTLRTRNARNPVLRGYYRLKDDRVTLVVHRQQLQQQQLQRRQNVNRTNQRGGGAGGVGNGQEMAEQTFHMELQIKSVYNKRHVQLIWRHYSVLTRTLNGAESTCTFDLTHNRFPPFWFSRVKSYTTDAEQPLV